MYCFIQFQRESPHQTLGLIDCTINVAHIIRIEPNPENDGTAITYTNGEKEMIIYTPTLYQEFLETLSGFQKVELIEILPY